MRKMYRLILLLLASLVGGCQLAPLQPPSVDEFAPADCQQWLKHVDQYSSRVGRHDAQYHREPKYPALAFNRLLASIEPQTDMEGEAWLYEAFLLASESRALEIQNWPTPASTELIQRTEECQQQRLSQLIQQQAWQDLAGVKVPDVYSNGQRALGVYSVSSLFLSKAIKSYQRDAKAQYSTVSIELDQLSYQLQDGNAEVSTPSSEQVATWLAQATVEHPLGLPKLSEEQLQGLWRQHAPELVVADKPENQIGELKLGELESSESGLYLDNTQPAAYVHSSYVPVNGRYLLQLVYYFWFPERTATSALDPYAGKLDGLVWRVTLGPDGKPWVYDSIHPCGCYHSFFSVNESLQAREPSAYKEAPLVLPLLQPAEDLEETLVTISLSSGDHQIQQVSLKSLADKSANTVKAYELRPYNQLRSVPNREGGRRSLFNQQGLIKESRRLERFYLWPSGVIASGSMRQHGHHATAFIGKRHFDDPDLFEKVFVWPRW